MAMERFLFKGAYKNKSGEIELELFLIKFQDENAIHFVYSPHFDLTGYGMSDQEALKSFKIVFSDFFDEVTEKNTFFKVLQKLGWQLDDLVKKNIIKPPPAFSSLAAQDYVSEIFDKFDVSTFRQSVGLPAGV